MSRTGQRLAPEVTRFLYVKGLAYEAEDEALFELFHKFGPIRQIRRGIAPNTKGTAFVVYEDIYEAKKALDKLNGYNFLSRYLVVLYHQPEKSLLATKTSGDDMAERRANLEALKQQHGIE